MQKLFKKNYNKIDLILSPAMGGIIIGYEIGKLLKKETIAMVRETIHQMSLQDI